MIPTWVPMALEVATHTVAVVCVFEGVRRIRALGVSKSAVLSATFGLIYCFGYAGLSYWSHNVQREAWVILDKGADIPELPIDWGANFPPQQRTNASHEIAEAAFSEHGQLRHYFDAAGTRLLFSPTQVDLDHREQKISQLQGLNLLRRKVQVVMSSGYSLRSLRPFSVFGGHGAILAILRSGRMLLDEIERHRLCQSLCRYTRP